MNVDVAVVGAGPAGIAAALAAMARGCSVLVIDSAARAGGQIWRQPRAGPGSHGPGDGSPGHATGAQVLAGFAQSGITHWSAATVFGATAGRLEIERGGAVEIVAARCVVLATGARDLVVPFPGWTLPGVLTAGAAQVLVRGHGVQPGRRALVAGSGPLLLPTAASLLASGCTVVGVHEAASWPELLRAAPAVVGDAGRRREALHFVKLLRAARVPYRTRMGIVAARGESAVEQVVVAPLDRRGRPRPEATQTFAVDLVCVGHGLQPQVELAAMLGCALHHDPVLGGVHVVTGHAGETSVEGVYAAGECAGVAGADVARIEGELAGTAIAHALGRPVPAAALAALVRRRRRARASARALLAPFAPKPGWFAAVSPDTVVCRCEDVTRSQLEQAAAQCGRDLRSVKLATRAGMGPCQGRTCARVIAELLDTDRVAAAAAVQWPLWPLPLQVLAAVPLPGAR